MNHVSRAHLNVALALAAVAVLMIAPLTFAQSTNYYNSMSPNPTANPSITNTIIPGAANLPTGNSNTTVVGVPNTDGTASGTSVPAVPNTGGMSGMSSAPGVPNTGAGGDANATLLTLALSALVAVGGIGTWVAMKKQSI